jgi:hypothetical protein
MSMDSDSQPSTVPGDGEGTDGPDSDQRITPSRLIAPGVGIVALVFIALTRPEVITGSFGTVGSTLRVLGLIVTFALFAWAIRRFVPNRALGRTVVWGLGAVLVLVAVVPAYFDEEVDQDLATSAADLGLEEADVPTPTTADPGPAGAGGADPATPTTEAPPEADAPPEKLTTGQLSGLAGHRGSGEAAVYELADGTRFVRLEDFEVSNGPGIELWVVPRAGAESPDGGTKLADLPGNTGNFNAAIPADLATSGDVTILLWCRPVGTPMAHATQSAA